MTRGGECGSGLVDFKPTVLMIHNYYQVPGGEDTVFRNEVEMLRQRGHKVIEYTKHNDDIKGVRGKFRLARSLFWNRRALREVRDIIRQENVDVVHCHNLFPLISTSVLAAARFEGIPAFQTIHNFRHVCPGALLFREGHCCEECLNGDLSPAIKHKCYKKSLLYSTVLVLSMKWQEARRVNAGVNLIFLTEFNKLKHELYLKRNRCNSFVKPNFVDVPDAVREHASMGVAMEAFVYAGRLEPEKGLLDLLEWWRSPFFAKKKLVVIGDGTLREVVECEARQNSNVVFLGSLAHDRVLEVIASSTALVFPGYLYEGMPMSVVESMSMGIPIVVRDVGNAADIVNESKAGVCFDGSLERRFEWAIKKVEQERWTLSRNGLEYSSDCFTVDANYRRLLGIYASQLVA